MKPAARLSSQPSDRALAEALARRLRDVALVQLFVRQLGPGDSVYASALARAGRSVVAAQGSGATLEAALEQLLSNLDHATHQETT